MSDPIVWENLPKSQADPETIEEAIVAGIDSHNADTNAHMGTDEAIEQHRLNNIIDHPAESIPNDKTFPQTRAYVAIVDPASEEDYDTIESALQYAISVGGGNIFVRNGVHLLAAGLVVPANVSIIGEGVDTAAINASAVTGPAVYPKAGKSRTYMLSSSVSVTDGSDVISVTGLEPAQGRSLVGRFIDLAFFTGPSRAKVIADLGGGDYQVDKDALLTTTAGDTQFLIGVSLMNGSDVVELLPESAFLANFLTVGMNISFGEAGGYYQIESFADDGTFTISSAWGGSTGETYIRGMTTTADRLYFSDIKFYVFGTAGFRGITTSDFSWQRPQIIFERVDLAALTNLFDCSGFAVGANRGILRCGAGYMIDSLGAFSAEDCLFIATQNGSKCLANCSDVSLSRCKFLANGYTSHYWISDDVGGYNVSFCEFESTREITTVADTWRFVGNNVAMSSTYAMTIDGARCTITDNDITKLTLGSSSANCVAVANMTDTAITDSGTSNTVASNEVY